MPTGSQDPYALRRQAQGIVQILLGMPLRLSLSAVVEEARRLLAAKLTEPEDVVRGRVLDFLRARLATLLVARGVRADVAEAVLAVGFDQPALALKRAQALADLMTRPGWEPLVVTFKRTINILPARPVGAVDPGRFVDAAERALHAETTECVPRVRLAIETEDYAGALAELAGLRPAVDRFFDAVMVMDKDPALQENRLALLKAIAEVLLSVADLRKIQSAS
jgi:glycyl-tRNA synthetase beta chain